MAFMPSEVSRHQLRSWVVSVVGLPQVDEEMTLHLADIGARLGSWRRRFGVGRNVGLKKVFVMCSIPFRTVDNHWIAFPAFVPPWRGGDGRVADLREWLLDVLHIGFAAQETTCLQLWWVGLQLHEAYPWWRTKFASKSTNICDLMELCGISYHRCKKRKIIVYNFGSVDDLRRREVKNALLRARWAPAGTAPSQASTPAYWPSELVDLVWAFAAGPAR